MTVVKRLQIMIEENLDAELGRQAAREGVSKAALIRRYVGERLRVLPPIEEDPLWGLVGMIKDGDPNSSQQIDEVVYGDLGGR
jgi:Ribbon-helix-helix protein, copG family